MQVTFSFSSGEYCFVRMDVISYHQWRHYNDYVFGFHTLSNPRKREIPDHDHSLVNVEIIHKSKLTVYNRDVERANKVVYTGGNLVINDYVEIIEEQNKYQKLYIAVLKKQLTEDDKWQPSSISDKHIVLCADNAFSGNRLRNLPPAQLGPEFEAYVQYENFRRWDKKTRDAIMELIGLDRDQDEETTKHIQTTKDLLEKKSDEYQRKANEYFNEFLAIRSEIRRYC